MLVYVSDKNFNIKYIIDYYKSVIWNTKLNELSDFEIYLPVLDNTILNNIKPNCFVWLDTDTKDRRIVEKIKVTYTPTDGYMLIISGYDARTLLKRRIIKYPIQYTDEYVVSFYVQEFIRQNCMEIDTDQPQDTNRIIDCIDTPIVDSFEFSTAQLFGENVFEKMKEFMMLDEYYTRGTRMIYENGKFKLRSYRHIDRTSSQTINERVIFSSKLGNLLEFNIELDASEFKNVAYVLGEGSGINRTMAVIGDENASDIDRYETSVNASELSKNAGTSSVITDAQYLKILQSAGEQYLTNYNKIYNFDCKIDASMYKFKKDYDLTDTVEIVTDFEINGKNSIKAIVDEVTESWNDEGYTCMPVLKFKP